MSYRLTPPRLFWNANLANVIDVPYALDNVVVGDTPRAGSEWAQAPSGVEDAWITGEDYTHEADYRWIPGTDQIGPKATGWDGTAGWQAMLRWARRKNQLRFHPDGRNLAISPLMNADADSDGVVNDFIKYNATMGVFSLDGTDGAQRADVPAAGNTTGVNAWCGPAQFIYGILAGEAISLSAEYRTAALANGVTPQFFIHFLDASNTLISGSSANPAPSATYVRNTPLTLTAPAGTDRIRVLLTLLVPANTGTLSAGSIWVRNALVRRGSTDTTFIDNPSWLCYLESPTDGQPQTESDGTRKLRLRLRQSASAFSGY